MKTKNHKVYRIEEADDLYNLQLDLKTRNSSSRVKWTAQELANNIVEYNEKADLSINGKTVVASIDLDTISPQSIDIINYSIKNLESKEPIFTSQPRSKNSYTYGGLGFISIFRMGFKYKTMKFKNKFMIICKLNTN
jgi:hypothetical protein